MRTFKIVTKLRIVGALAPALLLIATPVLAISLYGFGATPAYLYENQIAALRAAQDMDVALYRMEWARTQPDGDQVVKDQQRRFVSLLGSARDKIETEEQANQIEAIAKLAEPLFADLRSVLTDDQALAPRIRDLHKHINELVSADLGSLLAVATRAESHAWRMIVLAGFAGVFLPWTGFALVIMFSGRLDRALRAIRDDLKSADDGAKQPAAAAFAAIDETVASLGYPKPDPMLAE
ncbi:MAG: hypothetical protein ACREQF_04400 [Candidatus Binataceae bacterium]